jgi:hypothetical protein
MLEPACVVHGDNIRGLSASCEWRLVTFGAGGLFNERRRREQAAADGFWERAAMALRGASPQTDSSGIVDR